MKGQEKYEQSGDEVGRNNVKAYLNEKTKAVGKIITQLTSKSVPRKHRVGCTSCPIRADSVKEEGL